MIRVLLAAFTPTPEQLANGQFFLGLWLGTALGLYLGGYLIPEYGIAIYAHWRARRRLARRRRAAVIDFAERRRLRAVLALPRVQ